LKHDVTPVVENRLYYRAGKGWILDPGVTKLDLAVI